ncbi:MAG: hypothetical protein ACU84H_14440 [Gammaproteobacteria bacterium]
MPNDFVYSFLRSDTAKDQYRKASRLFSGASWVPSPFTDPKVGNNLSTWWQDSYDKLENLLENYAAGDFKKKWGSGRLSQTLDKFFSPGNPPSMRAEYTPSDICKAFVNELEEFEKDLGVVLRKQRNREGLGDALTDLRDASFTAGMGVIAMLENMSSHDILKDTYDETFNQLFLRDRTAALYEIVGDPPKEWYFGDSDSPSNYAEKAMGDISLFVGNLSIGNKLRSLFRSFDEAREKLGKSTSLDERIAAESQQREAVVELAILSQVLGKETERLSESSSTRRGYYRPDQSAAAAALSVICAEGMRGVLGLRPRGKGALTSSPDVKALLEFGEARAKEIKDKAEKRADPTDPRQYTESKR